MSLPDLAAREPRAMPLRTEAGTGGRSASGLIDSLEGHHIRGLALATVVAAWGGVVLFLTSA